MMSVKSKNIHVLPTEKPSRLFNCFGKLGIGDYITTRENLQVTNQNIYITSDEEIKEGDYYITILDNQVFKADNSTVRIMNDSNKSSETTYRNTHFKIILTTDQDLIKDGVQAIDDEFLEWFVKNTSCEEVEVVKHISDMSIYVDDIEKCNDINLVEYEIIIPSEKPKQETPEEIAQRYYEDEVSINAFINGYKIAQEFLCNHNHILTSEQGHRVIKCSKCNDTQPI